MLSYIANNPRLIFYILAITLTLTSIYLYKTKKDQAKSTVYTLLAFVLFIVTSLLIVKSIKTVPILLIFPAIAICYLLKQEHVKKLNRTIRKIPFKGLITSLTFLAITSYTAIYSYSFIQTETGLPPNLFQQTAIIFPTIVFSFVPLTLLLAIYTVLVFIYSGKEKSLSNNNFFINAVCIAAIYSIPINTLSFTLKLPETREFLLDTFIWSAFHKYNKKYCTNIETNNLEFTFVDIDKVVFAVPEGDSYRFAKRNCLLDWDESLE